MPKWACVKVLLNVPLVSATLKSGTVGGAECGAAKDRWIGIRAIARGLRTRYFDKVYVEVLSVCEIQLLRVKAVRDAIEIGGGATHTRGVPVAENGALGSAMLSIAVNAFCVGRDCRGDGTEG